jgi:hypothetical protein
MLVRKITTLYSEHDTKPMYKLCGHYAIIIEGGGTYSYHQDLNA